MPLFESAIGGIAVSLLEWTAKGGQYVTKEGKNAYTEVQDKQRVIAATNAYIDNYVNRHCKIKILPGLTKEPLGLESIYTAVKLLDERSVRLFTGLEELESTYRAKGSRGFGVADAERRKGIDIANNNRFLMVLGGPGIGKSTFLRKIGLEALKKGGELRRECIPVFLELKKFREEQIDIKQKIVEEFETCKFPTAETLVNSALEQGKLLVLFDGLDEVPSQRLNQVVEQIEDFVDRHDKNSFVASCRIAACHSSFRRFIDVTIAEFDDEQITQFIARWFGSREDEALGTADTYRELLFQDKHKATRELAQTPLLLTFLCLVYDREQTLPSKRSTLYERALNIILQEWSAQKRIERDPIYEGFHPELEKLMLAKIAYDSFKQDQLFFSKNAVAEHIAAFLADTLDAPKCLNADKVLTAIEVQQGILVERASNAYSFSHLTLQEYLTALHIVDTQKENELVLEHLTDERWREVFLLVTGLMSNRSIQLLNAIDKQARTYLDPYPKLKKLVDWAAVNRVGPSELSHRAAMLAIATVIDRSGAMASTSGSDMASTSGSVIAIGSGGTRTSGSDIYSTIIDATAIATAHAMVSTSGGIAVLIAISIDNDDVDSVAASASAVIINSSADSASKHHFLCTSLFKSIVVKRSYHQLIIPDANSSPGEWQMWTNQLQLIWLEALNLDIEDVTFSHEEARALRNYLYVNELLIQCKEAAIRVSRSEWEALERRLLTLDSGTLSTDV